MKVTQEEDFTRILFLKSGIDKLMEGSMLPACPSLTCLTGGIPKGLIFLKLCVGCLCSYVSFYINLCQD